MPLTLHILSYRNQPVPGGLAGSFGDAGGTVGRGTDNALVLDDPGKYISRVHARIVCREGAFFLEDAGSNPSVVNDRPLGKGRQIMLAHGDRIVIGDYQLQAVLEQVPAADPLLPAVPENDPALPLFVPPPPPAPVQLPPLEEAVQPMRAPGRAETLPDALAGASILDTGTGARFGAPGDDPLGLNLGGSGRARIPPPRAAESDHVSPELAAFPVMQAPRLPMAAVGYAIPDNYDPLADVLPRAAMLAVAPIPTAPQPAVTPSGDSEILQALLRGLGLPGLALNRPPAEVAESVGAMLREATAGTMDVLMARALTKKESRIDMTMLSVRANNPLKFFPNAEGALTQMLTGSMAGYMPPLQAMEGAFDDLRAHELAVIAGMRAALGAVLQRFDPVQIERRLAVPTVMDKMLSANRKAKLWDRLVELYGEIAREADDDLQRLFGEKFSEAYEEQVARMRTAQ